MNIINFSEIIEANGANIRTNNLQNKHNIPLGTLVEILPDTYEMENPEDKDETTGLRLYVVSHSRDCDGTPLYILSFTKKAFDEMNKYKNIIDNKNYDPDDPYAESIAKANFWKFSGMLTGNFSEASLQPII